MKPDPMKSRALVTALLSFQLLASPALAGPCDGKPAGEQLQSYCNAAKVSEKAADAHKATAFVYTGAAAVCLTSCFAAWITFGASQAVCTGSTLGAAGFEALKSQEFTGLIGSLGAHFLADKFATQAVSDLGPTQAVNKAACLSAAVNGAQSMMKYGAAKSEKDAAEQNRKLASRVYETNNGVAFNFTAPTVAAVGDAAMGGNPGSAANQGSGGTVSVSPVEEACSNGAKTGDFKSAVQCAIASDPNLPGALMDPRFGDDLKKVTGMDPSSFFQKVGEFGPAQALSGAMGANLTAEGASKLQKILQAMNSRVSSEVPSSLYAGGGGGGPKQSGGDGMDKMMADLMGNLLPKEKEEQKNGTQTLAFNSGAKRFPANVAEDSRVSIFERVTSRYHSLSPRVLVAPNLSSVPAANPLSNQGLPASLYR